MLGVDAVFKAPGTPCPHLCERGCGIYASRPEECAVYRCLWHIGVIGETRDRPDRLGVVFDVPADMEEQPLWRGIRFLVAREARPGAASSKRARAIIGTMAKVAVVLVEPFGRQVERMHGPESLMAEVRRRALDPGIKSSRPQAQE